MEIAEAVKKSFIFNNLSDSEISEILNITNERRFQEGDVIMQEGDKGDEMYLVLDGSVDVSKSLTMKFGDNDFRRTEKIHYMTKDEFDQWLAFAKKTAWKNYADTVDGGQEFLDLALEAMK